MEVRLIVGLGWLMKEVKGHSCGQIGFEVRHRLVEGGVRQKASAGPGEWKGEVEATAARLLPSPSTTPSTFSLLPSTEISSKLALLSKTSSAISSSPSFG